MTCNCELCKRVRELRAVKAKGDVAEMRSAIDKLLEDLGNTSEDLNYKTAILDGSWPGAREILTRAIEFIDSKPAAKTAASGAALVAAGEGRT